MLQKTLNLTIFPGCLARDLLFTGENVASNFEQVLVATPHEAPTIRPPASHHENYPSQTNQTRRTLLEKQG